MVLIMIQMVPVMQVMKMMITMAHWMMMIQLTTTSLYAQMMMVIPVMIVHQVLLT